jgi:hypothetical protein
VRVVLLKELSRDSSGETGEKHEENYQSRWSIPRPTSEAESRLMNINRCRNSNAPDMEIAKQV